MARNLDIAPAKPVCDEQSSFDDAIDLPPRGDLRMKFLFATANPAPITGVRNLMQSEFHEPDADNIRRIVRAVAQLVKLGLEGVEGIRVRLECFDQLDEFWCPIPQRPPQAGHSGIAIVQPKR